MVGVAENNLRIDGFYIGLIEGFDGSLRANRHKTGRLNGAMIGGNAPTASVGAGVGGEEGEEGHGG